jgi:hypothetical protein
MPEDKQQWLTRQQEMLVIKRGLLVINTKNG